MTEYSLLLPIFAPMKQRIHLITLICAILPLVMCSSPKAGKTDFSAALREADSVYNHMAFDKAYCMYLKMLDLPEVRSDDGKRLETLYSLCLVSEISGWNNDRLDWLDRLIDLARSTGDDYYLSQGLMLLGKHVFHSGDRGQGVAYIREAVDLLQHTDRPSTDHLTHSSLNVLSSLLCDMQDFDAAVEVDERNVRLTYEGTRWGTYPQVQLRDRRTALAKLAAHQVQAGKAQRADSTYLRWKEVALEEGSNPKDYFIVDYLRERGRYSEAPGIRHLCRSAGDKRHSAGLSGSLRCSRTRGTLRNTEERSPAASAQTVDYCLVFQIAAAAGTSRMDVMAVSESRGMRNTVTFNRIFRQTYGITPTEYLKSKS